MLSSKLQCYVIVVVQLMINQPVDGMIQCYVCSDTTTPSVDCLGTRTCGFDEICLNTIRDENGAHRVTKECKQTAACNVQVSQNTHSCHSESQPSVCYHCCDHDLCNAKEVPVASVGTTTEKSATRPREVTQSGANGVSEGTTRKSTEGPQQNTQSGANGESSNSFEPSNGDPSQQPTLSMDSMQTSPEANHGDNTSHQPTLILETSTEYEHGDLPEGFWLTWLLILLSVAAVLLALIMLCLYKSCRKIKGILCPTEASKDEDSKAEAHYENTQEKGVYIES